MSRSNNQPIMTNCYPIFKWSTGVPLPDNIEDENEMYDAMEKLSYDVHVDPDDKDE